jgi:hypothetical protein
MNNSKSISAVGMASVLISTVLALTPDSAMAQAGAVQQVETSRQRRQMEKMADNVSEAPAPELYPDEAADVGPQYVVVYQPRKTWFEAIGDVQYFYTDNVFLADGSGRESADVMVGTIQLAFAPTPYKLADGDFAPRVGYRHQWYLFGLMSDKRSDVFNFETLTTELDAKLDVFNFNTQTAFADARWSRGNWTAGVGIDLTRMMDSASYDEFYQESVPRWGLLWSRPVCESASIALGYEGDYRFTDTEIVVGTADEGFNDRTDHSLVLGLTQNLCRHALLQPYYRFQYTYFTEEAQAGDRRSDYLNSFGLALYCFFTDYASVRAFVSYDIMESSDSVVADYEKIDVGGGLTLNVRF